VSNAPNKALGETQFEHTAAHMDCRLPKVNAVAESQTSAVVSIPARNVIQSRTTLLRS
jgi:hypothetical protein